MNPPPPHTHVNKSYTVCLRTLVLVICSNTFLLYILRHHHPSCTLSTTTRGQLALAGGRTLRNIRGLENSDESRRTLGDSGVAWRQAHAMRRRLDRVNQTASLVSYEEQAGSAVSMAKAQRVRRRMHYAMPLQCFQVGVEKEIRDARSLEIFALVSLVGAAWRFVISIEKK